MQNVESKSFKKFVHHKKDGYSDKQRVILARSGKALPDGSYPIVTKVDLANAIQSYGRARFKGIAKTHIIKRAEEMHLLRLLPDKWKYKK
jgi:hypothetical protein